MSFLASIPLYIIVSLILFGGCFGWLVPASEVEMSDKIVPSLHYVIYQLIAIATASTLLRLLKFDDRASFVERIVLGNIVVGVIFVLVRFLTGLDMTVITLALGAILASISIYHRAPIRKPTKADGYELLVLLCGLIFPLLFSFDVLDHFVISEEKVIFKPWVDYFIHSGHVLQMSSGPLTGGNFMASGLNVGLYHYGQYMLSAFVYDATLLPLLAATTNILFPQGVMLLFCAIYLLSANIWGQKIGLLTAVFFFCLPDATFQLFNNLWLGTHWLIIASPGMLWGLAAMALACKYAFEFTETNDFRFLVLTLVVGLSVVFFRAHFAILGLSVLAMSIILHGKPLRFPAKLFFLAVLAGLIVLGLSLISTYLFLPFFEGPSQPGWYVGKIFKRDMPVLYSTLSALPLSWLTVTVVFIIAVCGWYLPLLISNLLLPKVRSKLHFISFPILMVGGYCLIIWFIPVTSFGTTDEMVHRPQVLVYSFVFLWAVGLTLSHLRAHPAFQKYGIPIAACLGLLMFSTKPYMSHGWGINRTYSYGLYDATQYIRTHGLAEDRVLDTSLDPTNFVVAMTEKKAFLSRYKEWAGRKNTSERNTLRFEKLAQLKEVTDKILTAKTVDEVTNLARDYGIQWLIKGPKTTLTWSNHTTPAFTSGAYLVFDLYTIQSGKRL